MSPPLDTRKYNDDLAGAVYFAVARGTEGGNASYHLAVAGLTEGDPPNENRTWGNRSYVADDSGYSLGTVQIDLGKRGTWPLGETKNRKLQAGEQTYVDAIIDEAARFARTEKLPFTSDKKLLRSQLLSHGGGPNGLQFIDTPTRNSINDWAQSPQGQSWIHTHMDMPQIQELTRNAVDLLNKHGGNVRDEDRFKAICMLAKTGNQLPGLVNGINSKKHGHITGLRETLIAGGDYADLEARAQKQQTYYRFLASSKAAQLGSYYEAHLAIPDIAERMHRAHEKVMSPNYSPANDARDPDIQQALDAYKHPVSRHKRADLSPAMQRDFDRIHTALQADGRWGASEIDNISMALLREVAGNDRVKQVDRVLVGQPAPLDGQVRVFAQYQPHGERGPHITTYVVADSASRTPALQNGAELEDVTRQRIDQHTIAAQQHEQATRSQAS